MRALFKAHWSTREMSGLQSLLFGRHEQEAAPENGRSR